MVKAYKKPEFKTVTFEVEDVITTSNGVATPAPPAEERPYPFLGSVRRYY